jgi:hypothetical protein
MNQITVPDCYKCGQMYIYLSHNGAVGLHYVMSQLMCFRSLTMSEGARLANEVGVTLVAFARKPNMPRIFRFQEVV